MLVGGRATDLNFIWLVERELDFKISRGAASRMYRCGYCQRILFVTPLSGSMPPKKRSGRYTKKDKAARENAIGWMDGMRSELCEPLVASYAEAVDQGWSEGEKEMSRILGLYHFHFPWPMKDTEEPAELLPYDPKPNVEVGLSEEQIVARRTHVVLYNKVSMPSCRDRWLNIPSNIRNGREFDAGLNVGARNYARRSRNKMLATRTTPSRCS